MKKIYDCTISLLTPLHIGSGAELQRDYDYVTHRGRTWVMNADKFLEDIFFKDGQPDERILGRPASELLSREDFRLESDYFRYVLQGQPRSQRYGAVLREQYKDVFDKPYLPGSSIKGALRTVLAWHGYQEKAVRLDVNQLGNSPKWAGQRIERPAIFGKDPNRDLLRALYVADSETQETERLQIINAQVVTGSEKLGAPIELEAVRSDTVLKTTLTIDEFLHSEAAEAELNFGDRWEWLLNIPTIAQKYCLEYVQNELQWYQKRKYHQVAGFYQQLTNFLKQKRLDENQFLIQIGWGGGWESKTIGQPLKADSAAWEKLLNHRRLSPSRFERRRGDEFPKSRRAVMSQDKPAAPLGWCLVEMKERRKEP